MAKNNTNLKQASAPERLKHLRKLARLTRAHIEAEYELPASTLKAWENGTARLTEKGLQRCIEIYRQEGIAISKEWILAGEGIPPKLAVDIKSYFAGGEYPIRPDHGSLASGVKDKSAPDYVGDDSTGMLREASFFKELYADAVVYMVPNEEMGPRFQAGDYVGGRFRSSKALETVIGKDCIVRLVNGNDILRRVLKSPKGYYNLACINPVPTAEEPVIFDAKIIAVAPVIWHRMPNL